MKLTDIAKAKDHAKKRDEAILIHDLVSNDQWGVEIVIGSYRMNWRSVVAKVRPVALSALRECIEELEADLRALGVEVEPHFKTDADGWLKPTGELAEELTKRGYTLVQTGGGCTAWVKVMADGDNVVVTDTQGTSDAGYDDWIVGRYDGDDWENGDAAASEDNDKGETIWQVIERYENTPRQPAELFDRAPFRSEDDGA